MMITFASTGKFVAALLAFGEPLRWKLGKHTGPEYHHSWSGEEIIDAVRHEQSRMSWNDGQQQQQAPQRPGGFAAMQQRLSTQAREKINKVIQADLLHQQERMLKKQQQNGSSSSSSSTSSGSGTSTGSLSRSQKPPKFSRRLTVEVCLSPGCIADGAAVTMEKLQALAPAHARIQQGSCSSFCGAGPVVVTLLEEESSLQSGRPVLVEKKSHKRIKDDKIMELLYPGGAAGTEGGGPPEELVQGYDLVLKGDAMFANLEHAKALEYYEAAVRVAFTSAVELQNERDRFHAHWTQHHQEEAENDKSNDEAEMENNNDDDDDTAASSTSTSTLIPVELEWLIRARRNEARCKLELGDLEGSVLAAQASCNLSRNTSSESFHVLAEVYKRKEDGVGEMQALQKMLSLPVPTTSGSAGASIRSQQQAKFAMENQRRIAGIRVQKLERDYESQQP